MVEINKYGSSQIPFNILMIHYCKRFFTLYIAIRTDIPLFFKGYHRRFTVQDNNNEQLA